MNEKGFFEVVHSHLGKLNQTQVKGFQTLLNRWNLSLLTDFRWMAYALATAWHETWFTMQPIREQGNLKYLKSKQYYPYYGRGYVQLTWKVNYAKYGIAATPDKALDPDFAAKILIDGMVHGVFTGKKFADYFGLHADPINARRIINGTDKAMEIAGYYAVFNSALIEYKKADLTPS